MKKLFFLLLLTLISLNLYSQEIFNGCPMEGSTNKAKYIALNLLKNRFLLPASSDFKLNISLDDFLISGNDEDRFSESDAVKIEGYVYNVKIGGIESCNCRAKDEANRDIHIEITPTAKTKTYKKRLIAEVTPRLREKLFSELNISTNKELRKLLKGKKVRISGWLMFDAEHKLESYNIDPANKKGRKNWRATCWEIHPITKIEIID